MTRKRASPSRPGKAASKAKPGKAAVDREPLHFFTKLKFVRAEFGRSPELASVVKDFTDEVVDAEFSEVDDENGLEYRELKSDIGALLEQKLRDGGLSEPNAALLAHATMQHFQQADDLSDPKLIAVAVDLALALLRGVDTLTAAFNAAAELPLPKEAPEKWAERDRAKGENPIEFLNRVWGAYMRAGVLYQDDLKRLGDSKLLPAIRAYCQRHPDIKAADVLPPPQSQRIDDALAAARPGSIEEQLLRNRIQNREAVRFSKRRSRQQTP